jgi:hypothetical protein
VENTAQLIQALPPGEILDAALKAFFKFQAAQKEAEPAKGPEKKSAKDPKKSPKGKGSGKKPAKKNTPPPAAKNALPPTPEQPAQITA